MRFLEVLLSLANLAALLRSVIPRLRGWRWAGHAAPVALLLAVTQVLVEGARWQMIPAYALTTGLFLIWLIGLGSPGRPRAGRLVSLLGAGTAVIVLVASVALPIVLPVFRFPAPTGPYAIGTVTYHWIDTGRPELFTADPGDHRELMAQVWYPAERKPSAPRAPYIQDADAVTPALARLTRLPGFLFTHFDQVTTNAVAGAPVAGGKATYPVLVYFSGLDGFRAVNTFQVEELVSHGYIVVGLDQPGAVAMVRFPDGRQISGRPKDEISPLIEQSVERRPKTPALDGRPLPDGIIPYFAQDAGFALDELSEVNESDPHDILRGRLDLGRAGAFGISLGGMNVAAACAKDPRLKACLVMDVYLPADVVKAGLRQPCMFMTRDAGTMRLERERIGGWTEKDISLTLDTMRAVYENLPGDGYHVEVPAMFHLNFTDLPYWSPLTSQLGLTGPIDGQRAFDIVNAYSLAFFDKELKGLSSSLLDGPTKRYPEVNFETLRAG